MNVRWKDAGDRERLEGEVRAAAKAVQRDRYRVVLLAGAGDEGEGGRELTREQIAARVGRSRQFVDEWVGRYRSGGVGRLRAKRQPGRTPKLTAAQAEQLRARLDAGPRDADGVCALRGRDVCRIIEAEFGVVHTVGGIYDVLRRVGYASLVPRPRHRKNDPAAMEQFVTGAPLLPAP
jgi:transposase